MAMSTSASSLLLSPNPRFSSSRNPSPTASLWSLPTPSRPRSFGGSSATTSFRPRPMVAAPDSPEELRRERAERVAVGWERSTGFRGRSCFRPGVHQGAIHLSSDSISSSDIQLSGESSFLSILGRSMLFCFSIHWILRLFAPLRLLLSVTATLILRR
ncbi:2-Cys peroxiredoxin BAS1, chloroplastic-like [Iris pallida]|uniref:2-Cys peroxiredoxin BAS1, chloroplastic-like n=1 Tax=Iris pallida TaxID=29817 RepID=A0AAX6I3C8_IRIPA|nr:2-Cys peroxiredoxin BAS1, chloroplastic-like [Iris pallida]